VRELVALVQVRAPVWQAKQAPALRKNPGLQTVAYIVFVQVAAFGPQFEHRPKPERKNPFMQI
jgi:hypothetical protein